MIIPVLNNESALWADSNQYHLSEQLFLFVLAYKLCNRITEQELRIKLSEYLDTGR